MTSMRQVWRELPRPNSINCACCMVFGFVCPYFQHFCDAAANWQKTALVGQSMVSLRGEPFTVVFDGSSCVFDPSCSQLSQNGVPIVLLTHRRARAPVQEHYQPHWDSILGCFQ